MIPASSAGLQLNADMSRRSRSLINGARVTRPLPIRRAREKTVDFGTPARPSLEYLANPKEFIERIRMEWIGRNVPVADARWLGELLARLSPKQMRDAFRAAALAEDRAEYKVIDRRPAPIGVGDLLGLHLRGHEADLPTHDIRLCA